MRVGPATNVARINVTESITALWTFAHANGISLDDIIERTADAGITIDGALLKDNAIQFLGRASDASLVFRSDVVGDSAQRFAQRADGQHQWGDGAGARDVTLYRRVADVLKTDDDFEVGGVLKPLGIVEVSVDSPAALNADKHDYVIDDVLYLLMTTDGVARTITGIAGGTDGRLLFINHVTGSGALQLAHMSGSSIVGNRIMLPSGSTLVMATRDACTMIYDGPSNLWRLVSQSIA